MKILILEDEPRAASQLLKILRQCEFDYDSHAIVDSVEEAVKWFTSNTQPELIFMDIQLADGLSFEIFQSVDIQCPIIFTTAFDQYAIKAFKFNSVDYLLKPIKQIDLQASLDKYVRSQKASVLDQSTMDSLLSLIQSNKEAFREGILVKEGGGFVQLKVADIQYLYSEDSISFAVTATKRYIVDETLDQFFSTVDHSVFFKINRGQIVHKVSVQRLEPYPNHRLILKLNNGGESEFIVSRQRTSDFKVWMNS